MVNQDPNRKRRFSSISGDFSGTYPPRTPGWQTHDQTTQPFSPPQPRSSHLTRDPNSPRAISLQSLASVAYPASTIPELRQQSSFEDTEHGIPSIDIQEGHLLLQKYNATFPSFPPKPALLRVQLATIINLTVNQIFHLDSSNISSSLLRPKEDVGFVICLHEEVDGCILVCVSSCCQLSFRQR